MHIKLVFEDWKNKKHESVYTTAEGIELSLGDFHSGTVFNGTIECDEEELRNALKNGYRPVFYITGACKA